MLLAVDSATWQRVECCNRIVSTSTYEDYFPDAFVPEGGWEPICSAQKSTLQGIDGDINPLKVKLFSLSVQTLGLVQSEIQSKYSETSHPFVRASRFLSYTEEDILVSLMMEVCDYIESPERLALETVSLGLPNQRTTTFDPNKGKFLGLHLDECDSLAIAERNQSIQRMCINVGLEPRYFLFVDKSLHQMARDLGRDIDSFGSAKQLGKLFMRKFPETAVIKVSILPGEGYIAPTDALVHDGSTVGTKTTDATLVFRGFFGC